MIDMIEHNVNKLYQHIHFQECVNNARGDRGRTSCTVRHSKIGYEVVWPELTVALATLI